MIRLLFLSVLILFGIEMAQSNVVKGAVHSSEDNMPIVGAGVEVSADSVVSANVKTDNRGHFSVIVPKEVKLCVITVSCPGYDSQVLSINNLSEDMDLGAISLIPSSSTLDVLVVTASTSREIIFPDKSIVFPTREEKERAKNPLNLVAQIAFAVPAINVDEYTKTMKIMGQEPQILINGVRRTYDDFNALDPKNVVKIEYITRRDIRYGAPYINIITAKLPTGGSVMATADVPLSNREETHQGYASYRRGKHEFSIHYRGTFRDHHKEHSDQTELYHYPDRTAAYDITGLPSRKIDRHQTASVEYSLTASSKKFLVATGRFEYHSQDGHQGYDCDTPGGMFLRRSNKESRTLNPSLNVYGSLPITDNGRLEVNVMGSYQSGSYANAMWQTDGYANDVSTSSRAYTTSGDIYYGHRLLKATLGVGITQTFTNSTNHYIIDSRSERERLHKSKTEAYVSIGGGSIVSYYAALGVTHTKVEKGNTSPYAYLSLQKEIQGFNLSYSLSASSYTPWLSTFSDVVLPVNEILYRSGNCKFKDIFSLQNQLYCSYSYKKFSSSLSLRYLVQTHTGLTICEYISDRDSPLFDKFLETRENARRQNDFGTTLTAGLYGLLGHYSVKVSASFIDQCARGDEHKWRNSRVNSLDVAVGTYFGPWQVAVYAGIIPDKTLSGNFMWQQRSSWSLEGSWHKNAWTVSCTVADLFRKKAFYEKKTTMSIGMYTSELFWIGDKSNWVGLSVRYQFSFGEHANRQGRTVSGNTNVDSGVNL